jgi:hypothetical protein
MLAWLLGGVLVSGWGLLLIARATAWFRESKRKQFQVNDPLERWHPLKGRWLRYFDCGMLAVFGLCYLLVGILLLAASLPPLLNP